MTSLRDRMEALRPTESPMTRGGSNRPQDSGNWSAFSRETKSPNYGKTISQTIKATENSEVAKAAIAEKRKYDEAVNLTSEKAYPALTSQVLKPRTTLDFRATVKAVLAKEESEEDTVNEVEKSVSKPKLKTVISFIDSFDDDDDDDEDEGDGDCEFNAEIVQNRRRGDKGIW